MIGLEGWMEGKSCQESNFPPLPPKRRAWNKGRLVGQKRPLLTKQVWAIRARLELADNLRDLALFNVAIDSKLRGCDLVTLKVTILLRMKGCEKEYRSFKARRTIRCSLNWLKTREKL
jgi:hypothetical protein